jgi:23S rRNA (pseudouridine1915-N3)-methyltransferase
MAINLIAIGKKMPPWVNQGFQEYTKRMPTEFNLNLIEISASKRTKNTDIQRAITREGNLMLQAIPTKQNVIALDLSGKSWKTEELAKQMQLWREDGRDVSLLIGGPEGLSQECLARAETKWSLSPLTFPHPLVRVIVAEQLYRAWSILNHHPYHR